MNERQSKDHEPPVGPDEERIVGLLGDDIARSLEHAAWSDERFLRWLAEREAKGPASNLETAGRRLIVRAYCRYFGIRLFAGPAPAVKRTADAHTELVAPLVDLSTIGRHTAPVTDVAIVVPSEWTVSPCVACRVTVPIDCAAQFIAVGDTLLLARAAPNAARAALSYADGRFCVSEDIDARDSRGAVIALWSVVMA